MLLGWTGLLGCSIGAGAAGCAWLVAPRRATIRFALLTVLLGAMAVGSFLLLSRAAPRTDGLIAAAFIGVGALLGGFALAAALLPSLTRMPPLPAVVAPLDSASHRASPTVIVLADGQPEVYEPTVVTDSFERLVATDVPTPPDAIRVFAYFSERMRYRSAGMSPARPVVRSLTSRVSDGLQRRGLDGPVREAWLRGTPRLADAIADAVAAGSDTVVVALLDTIESPAYEVARAQVDAVAPKRSGVRVSYGPPLWSDPTLARRVTERTLAALPQGPRATDGIVLVAQGQPWQWDSEWPQSCEQTTFFVQRVRAGLVAAGALEANVRAAWLDWQDPGVTEVVRHLAALGCERIVIVPATTPADTLETAIDLPAAVEQAAIDPGIKIEILHGWGDDPAIATVLVDEIERGLSELGDAERQ
ncbi:MAG: ferrochelatase [Coriobacteriia bacterium]|nr:ferrochelatase [Coriobacteriia bacterium]